MPTKSKEFKPRPPKDPSARQKRLLDAFGGLNKPTTLQDLGNRAFTRERPESKRNSWARNNIRWLLQQKFVKKVKPGTYMRVC